MELFFGSAEKGQKCFGRVAAKNQPAGGSKSRNDFQETLTLVNHEAQNLKLTMKPNTNSQVKLKIQDESAKFCAEF